MFERGEESADDRGVECQGMEEGERKRARKSSWIYDGDDEAECGSGCGKVEEGRSIKDERRRGVVEHDMDTYHIPINTGRRSARLQLKTKTKKNRNSTSEHHERRKDGRGNSIR